MVGHRFFLSLAVLTSLCLAASTRVLSADDEEKPKSPATEPKDEKKKDDDKFVVPEGGMKELLAFIKEASAFRPTKREEIAKYQQAQKAIKQALEKIQEVATDEEKQTPEYKEAMEQLLVFRAQASSTMPLEDLKKLLAEVKTALAAKDITAMSLPLRAARQICISLEYAPQEDRREYAVEAYREIGDMLAESKDAEVAKIGANMQGAVRRLTLVGKPLELNGTEMDGAKFDWAKYRGKVVLVDFWATWCGPCKAELPNVKKNYEAYHDRGFEVVGISLDRDRKALEAFLEKEETPWLTLHDGDWSDNATANYYGIVGIPTVMLVDKEGKVVSTNARGAQLTKLLADMLGPALPADDSKPAEAPDKPEK